MKCLIETDKYGNWGLRELPWKNLYTGTPITWETYETLYGALCKLKDYEDTGLSPAEVEELRRQQDSHCWIPVEKGIPEEYQTIFAKLKGTIKWSNSMFEKRSNEVNVTIEDDKGKKVVTHACTIDGKWSCDLLRCNKTYHITAWQPLPGPYGEKK